MLDTVFFRFFFCHAAKLLLNSILTVVSPSSLQMPSSLKERATDFSSPTLKPTGEECFREFTQIVDSFVVCYFSHRTCLSNTFFVVCRGN